MHLGQPVDQRRVDVRGAPTSTGIPSTRGTCLNAYLGEMGRTNVMVDAVCVERVINLDEELPLNTDLQVVTVDV